VGHGSGEKSITAPTGPNGAIDLTADPTIGLDNELKEDFLKAKAEIYDVYYNALGGRLRVAYSGGGMLPPDLHEAFLTINFPS
jgi:long-chain acyl-CoA synthetase